MQLNIFSKLFLAMLAGMVLVVAVMAVFMNWSFRTGFEAYQHGGELDKARQLAGVLGEGFGQQGSWDFIRYEPHNWNRALVQIGENPPLPGPQAPISPRRQERSPQPLGGRLNLLDANQQAVIGPPENLHPHQGSILTRLEIKSQGQVVGWLAVRQGKLATDVLAKAFLDQQLRNSYLIALFAAALSLLLALLLVRHLIRPVRSLTAGAKLLTAGRFDTRIEVATQDELGVLANDFNLLATALQRNEEIRRQWLADISHELRTPIAILRSEIEALLDGIRQPTVERIRSLHVDVLSLGKLVDDLYQLSLSDAGDMELPDETVDLAAILDDTMSAAEANLQEKHIGLFRRIDDTVTLAVRGDAKRLHQLFSNLLANSQRYTDEGGRVEVFAQQQGDKVVVEVQDTAPGVPDEALPHLFERLFRVDKSRSRALGGSGLGLSICKNIVEAHHGTITAGHSALGGLSIRMEFPLPSA
ncbi:MAG: ATP-binding protein [Thiothrix sp.]|uniref:ATP-binding protein n=1 Tax=Thiothrix sp. TaxID=1032 RepID=UPI0026289871|nr:ATP-binding protein [Thiothrix sp.]MDD5391530.1 ATP-binding protein [Thiothrix sp.]